MRLSVITIYEPDPNGVVGKSALERECWSFNDIEGDLYLVYYGVEYRETKRHAWKKRTTASWSAYDNRYGISRKDVPLPDLVVREALDRFRNRTIRVYSRPGPGCKLLLEV